MAQQKRAGWLPGPWGFVLNHYGIRLFPFSLAEKVITPIAMTIYRLQGGKLEKAKENYAVISGRSVDDPMVDRMARKSLRHFGRYIAEMIHVQAWTNEAVLDRLEVYGESNFEKAEAMEKGIIFVSAHMGSAEIAASLVVLRGYSVTAVTEQLRPKFVMDWAVACRAALGVTLVPLTRAGVKLIRALRRKETVAMIVDAGIEEGGGVPVRFLGRETVFPEGPARLARLSGAPIVFAIAVRLPGGRFRAVVCEPIVPDRAVDGEDDIVRMTQAIADQFEPFVKQFPEQWYVFRDIWPNATAKGASSA